MTEQTKGQESVPIHPAKPTIFQSFLIGSAAGATEVLVNHPLWNIKIRIQCNDPFTLNPKILYRGVLPSALSFVPGAALQVGLNRFFQKTLFVDVPQLSKAQQISTAFTAGVISALIRCPTELIMTQQRITNSSFYQTFRHLLHHNGFWSLYTGYPAIATRSGIFAASFLAITPILKSRVSELGINPAIASLSSGIIAGMTAAIVTQSFDTITAYQHAHIHKESISIYKAVKQLYDQGGILRFYRGGSPRVVRVASATCIMAWTNERLSLFFTKDRS